MRTLYLDCGMGAAGDMLTAALLELLPDGPAFVQRLNGLGLPGVTFEAESSVKCGIRGTHMTVRVNGQEEGEGHGHHGDHAHHHHHHETEEHHHHHHATLHAVGHIVSDLPVSKRVKEDVLAVYDRIARAESHVHGVPVEEIHFHEVGTMDAIADVTAVCLLMETLAPDEVVVSPVHVGSGQVRCAHGLLPVPAPATAWLLRDVPIYGGELQGELCTPTGAALLCHFAHRFGPLPLMRTEAVGYGMGKKDFPAANCVRALLGRSGEESDLIYELSCNVDDMGAEDIGFAMERLFDGGAREVYTVPVGMKKNRPGTLLRVMCAPADKERLIGLLFRHTTTLGVREAETRRHILDRRVETVETALGPVRRKESTGYGVTRRKWEYEDLARIARERDLSLAEVRREIGES